MWSGCHEFHFILPSLLLHLPHPNPHGFRAIMRSTEHYFPQLAKKYFPPEIFPTLHRLRNTYTASPSHLAPSEIQHPPPAPPEGCAHDLQYQQLAS